MFLKTFFGEVGNPHPCSNCQGDDLLDFEVRMAFQPIVDSATRTGIRGAGARGAGARAPVR